MFKQQRAEKARKKKEKIVTELVFGFIDNGDAKACLEKKKLSSELCKNCKLLCRTFEMFG